ncbi:MAG: hypothetical protein V1808_01575 [Candidatus Daviesbacteria bacterium]
MICKESECPCEADVICDTALLARIRKNWGADIFDPFEAQTVVINAIANRENLSPVDSEALQRISNGKFSRSFLEVRKEILRERLMRDDVVHEWEFDGH